MKQHILLIGLATATCFAWGQETADAGDMLQGLDIQAERGQIAKDRKQAEDIYKTAVKACFQKVAVNACKEEAQQIKFQKDNDLRRRELVLNEAERRNAASKALKSAEERQNPEKQALDAERRREAQEMHLDKLQQNIEKKEQRLQKEAEVSANREARAKQLEEVLERQRAHEAKLKEASRSQEIYQRKLQDAQEHRAQVEKDRAKRNPAVEPLPPRSEIKP